LMTCTFSRGWTLQELIAPRSVLFFDSNWQTNLGNRSRSSKLHLALMLASITRIDAELLTGSRSLQSYCVAQKMSWASHRKTTRTEDIAYCLLGLFELNIPLLYGEGDRVFVRPQEEIIRSTADSSIFAWKLPPLQRGKQIDMLGLPKVFDSEADEVYATSNVLSGVLAHSPQEFYDCRQYTWVTPARLQEFAMTNIGVRTRSRLLHYYGKIRDRFFILPLHCNNTQGLSLGIHLRQVGEERYLRQNPWNLVRYKTDNIVPWPLSERYLYTTFPKHQLWSCERLICAKALKQDMWRHTLRICYSSGLDIENV
jgi:hypothetical protein